MDAIFPEVKITASLQATRYRANQDFPVLPWLSWCKVELAVKEMSPWDGKKSGGRAAEEPE